MLNRGKADLLGRHLRAAVIVLECKHNDKKTIQDSFLSARVVCLRSNDFDTLIGYAKSKLTCHFGVQLLVKAGHETVPLLSDLAS